MRASRRPARCRRNHRRVYFLLYMFAIVHVRGARPRAEAAGQRGVVLRRRAAASARPAGAARDAATERPSPRPVNREA